MPLDWLHSDIHQTRRIKDLEYATLGTDETLAALSERLQEQAAEIERLKLTTAALLELLRLRLGIKPDEIDLMVQRLDLADGVEDGRIGPDRSRHAPRCAGCGRPVNPQRARCVFCDRALPKADKPAPPPPRMTRCASCGRELREDATFFSETGLVCGDCFGG